MKRVRLPTYKHSTCVYVYVFDSLGIELDSYLLHSLFGLRVSHFLACPKLYMSYWRVAVDGTCKFLTVLIFIFQMLYLSSDKWNTGWNVFSYVFCKITLLNFLKNNIIGKVNFSMQISAIPFLQYATLLVSRPRA